MGWQIQDDAAVLTNLEDAGCDAAMIEKYFSLGKEGKEKEQYRLLAQYKISLLDKLHASQRMIDCLDHLMFSMKQNKKKKEGY